MCYLDAMEHKKYKIAHRSERKSKCQFQRGVTNQSKTKTYANQTRKTNTLMA